eukprot:jgi/Ulvmu1/1913/UM012_0073.1
MSSHAAKQQQSHQTPMSLSRRVFIWCGSAILLLCIYSCARTGLYEGEVWSAWTAKELRRVKAISSRSTDLFRPYTIDASSGPTLHSAREREDAWCSTAVEPTLAEPERAAMLFDCRAKVARKRAMAECARLERAPPDPPFAQASLNLRRYIAGHAPLRDLARNYTEEPLEMPARLTIAVEPEADIVSDALQRRGTWEISEVEAVLTALERSDVLRNAIASLSAPPPDAAPAAPPVLVDIGANLGVYTIVAAALGYPVIAFEALPRNVAAIHQTLCWNPELAERVTLFPYALGAAERSCVVMSDDGNVGDGHLGCTNGAVISRLRKRMPPRAAVQSVRLGDYLAGVPVDVLKLDVEGYEPMVLAGAGSVLDGVHFALSEISSDMGSKAGRSFRSVVREYLHTWDERGFDVHFCEPGFGCLMGGAWPMADAAREAEARGLSNALFVRRRDTRPIDPDTDDDMEPEAAGPDA